MIKKIKRNFQSESNKRLLSNFFALTLFQGINYILPLITLSYLVKVLGIEYFGLLAFASAMIAYFNVITDYGFNLTATREISINRQNTNKIIEIFSSVMSIKFILLLVSFILLSIIIFSFEKLSKDWQIYYFTFGIVIGQILFPIWFFQGMERMKYITYLNLLSKLIFTIAVFIFVNKPSDFYIVPLLTSIGSIVAGIWSLIIIKKEFNINFKFQSLKTLKYYFTDGWNIFTANLSINIFTTSNVIFIGLLFDDYIVGIYSIVEKIIGVLRRLSEPINQVFFPYLAKKSSNDRIKIVRKIYFITIFLYIIIALIISNMSNYIAIYLDIHNIQLFNTILNLMLFTLIIIINNNIIGVQVLINSNLKKEFQNIILSATIFYLLIISFSFKFITIINDFLYIGMFIEFYIAFLMIKISIRRINLK